MPEPPSLCPDERTIFGALREFYPMVHRAFDLHCRECQSDNVQIAQRLEPGDPAMQAAFTPTDGSAPHFLPDKHVHVSVTVWLRCGDCGTFALLWDGHL